MARYILRQELHRRKAESQYELLREELNRRHNSSHLRHGDGEEQTGLIETETPDSDSEAIDPEDPVVDRIEHIYSRAKEKFQQNPLIHIFIARFHGSYTKV